MITAQVECLTEMLEEIKAILPIHYKELALNQDKVPLDPQYEEYIKKDSEGGIIYVTLRESGNLIGYFVGFIAPGLHYKTCLTCHMDIFYVHPDHRRKRGGILLYTAVEKELKRRGVQRIYAGFKVHMPDAKRLYEAMGYKPCEQTYTKWLGE